MTKEHLVKAALNLIRLDNIEGANLIVDAELQRCEDQGNTAEIWSLRFMHADILRLRGSTEEALQYLACKESLYPPESEDRASAVELKKHRGYCLGLIGRYQESFELLREAERIARDAALTELLCEIHQRQAMMFYLKHDYVSSDRVFRLILDESEQIGGWYFRANALWGIGKNLMIQNHYESAIPWLSDSLELFESAGARLSMAAAWSELAVCYLGLGDDQRALDLLENSLQIEATFGTIHNYQVVLSDIGNVYLYRGDHLTAIGYYRQALALAQKIKAPASIQKCSYNIRLAYARLRQAVDEIDTKTS